MRKKAVAEREMSPSSCSDGQYLSATGHCCRLCDAGTHKLKDCNRTTDTQCRECGRGYFMAAKNSLDKCLQCKSCNSRNQEPKQLCTAREDTVCACVSGFFCSEDSCDHCRRVSPCPEGYGVRTPATRTNNTICAPCEDGTFSNVSDSVSRCRPHTRCEHIGRKLDTKGTPTADAVCGKICKSACDWTLPAGLWAGFVVTSLMVFALVLVWRIRRRRLQGEESLSQPEAPVDVVPEDEVQLKLPLPSKELSELYQEQTYSPSYCCELPAFESDAPVNGCGPEGSSAPITPFKASKSFSERQRLNSSSSFLSSSYRRTISEPQEDEWCGT